MRIMHEQWVMQQETSNITARGGGQYGCPIRVEVYRWGVAVSNSGHM